MRSTVKKAMIGLVLLVGVGTLGACNTVAGAGQDLQNAAHDVQQKL